LGAISIKFQTIFALLIAAALIVVLVFCALPMVFWANFSKALGPHYSDGLPATLSGVIEPNGKLILPVRYLAIGDFHEGLASITNGEYKDGKKFYTGYSRDPKKLSGYIDIDGKLRLKPLWWHPGDFSDGLARVSENDDQVIFMDHSGKKVLGPYKDITDFKNGMAIQGINGSSEDPLVAIDTSGRKLHNAILDELKANHAESFATFDYLQEGGFATTTEGIMRGGTLVVKAKWDNCRNFSEGLAAVAVDKKWGYVDCLGHYKIPPQFEEASAFSNSLARVRKGGKWGFIDRSGKLVIKPAFEQVEDFAEDYARFAKTGANGSPVWGFINRDGQVVVAPRYVEAHNFSDGRAAVKTITFSQWGFIDKSGKIVVADTYDNVSDFHEHRAVVTKKYP
jgi:hypothetical protein